MKETVKQRLIGALILLALAVVFWPIIFVEPQPGSIASPMAVPPRPMIDTRPIPSPNPDSVSRPRASAAKQAATEERLSATADPDTTAATEPEADAGRDSAAGETAASAPAAAVVTSPGPRDTAPERPSLDEDGVPIAWVLQVASVSSVEKARELRDALIAKGHKAYIETIRVEGRRLQRVYVGPKFERAKLDQLKQTVDREFGVNTLVKRYVP